MHSCGSTGDQRGQRVIFHGIGIDNKEARQKLAGGELSGRETLVGGRARSSLARA